MKVTSKTVAELAGVSRGTVDRALNNRGQVKAEVKARILKIADELNYKPNKAARALVNAKRVYDIRFIIHNTRANYWNEMKTAVIKSVATYKEYGLELNFVELDSQDPVELLSRLDECLENPPDYLILPPYNNHQVREKLLLLVDKNIPFITIDSSMENNPSPCHIATDALLDGRIMAGLFNFLFSEKKPRILIMYAYQNHLASERRTEGFLSELHDLKQDYELLDKIEITGKSQTAYYETRIALEKHQNIDAIFISSGNLEGACNALIDLELNKKIRLLAFDIMGKSRHYLDSGTVTATLCNANIEIAEACIKKVSDELVFGVKNDEKQIVVENRIKLAQCPE